LSITGKSDLSYPYLTSDLPGTGGIFKESPEDFEVTEIPLYEPCGEGEHTYALIEKRGLTTLEMNRRLAKALEISERDIGYAGMKDAKGITRQTVSLKGTSPEQVARLNIPNMKVLSAKRHGNKLRLGHLAGNSFRIRLRDVSANAASLAENCLAIIMTRGLPNYFGSQRYGVRGNSAQAGLKLLAGDFAGAVNAILGNPDDISDERWRSALQAYADGNAAAALELFPPHCRTEKEIVRVLAKKPGEWEKALKSVHPKIIDLYLSAAQSQLFDLTVAARIAALDRVSSGDIACKHANGACFLVTDEAEAATRAAQFEISATGPMFGKKMLLPQGDTALLEEGILKDAGVERGIFNKAGRFSLDGERRPLRVQLKDPTVEMQDGTLLLEFSLPKGSYATTLLREIMK